MTRLCTVSFDIGGPQSTSGPASANVMLDGTMSPTDFPLSSVVPGRTNSAVRIDSDTGLQADLGQVLVGGPPLVADDPSENVKRFYRAYVGFEDLPASGTAVSFITGSGITIYVDDTGRLIYRSLVGLSSGSDYGATDTGCPVEGGQYLDAIVPVDTWVRLEFALAEMFPRSPIVFRLGGEIIGRRCAARNSVVAGDELQLGWKEVWPVGSGMGAGKGVLFDDVAINDGKSADQNTWPGPGHVYVCKPISAGGSYPWAAGAINTTAGGIEAGTRANECTPTTGAPLVLCTSGGMDAPLARTPPLPIGLDPVDDAHRCDYVDREVICGATDWWKDLQVGPVCAINYTAPRFSGAGETLTVEFEDPTSLGASGVVTLAQQRLLSYRNNGAGNGSGSPGDGILNDPSYFRLTDNPLGSVPVLGDPGYLTTTGDTYRNFGSVQLGEVFYEPSLDLGAVIEGEYIKVGKMRDFNTSLHYAGRLPWSLITTNVLVETGFEAQDPLPTCDFLSQT